VVAAATLELSRVCHWVAGQTDVARQLLKKTG